MQLVNLNTSSLPTSLVNHYEVIPSFHITKSLLVGIAAIHIAKTWWLKLGRVLLPLLMLVTMVATANHFVRQSKSIGRIKVT